MAQALAGQLSYFISLSDPEPQATMMAPCSTGKSGKTVPSNLLLAYGLFISRAGGVWHLVADGDFSSILTMSVMVQCLAAVLLALQVVSTGSASGILARALALDVLAICCRLSSTSWLNGYLPVDASGDHIFQAVDVCSLGVLAWLPHQTLVLKQNTYQADEDSMPIVPIAIGALILVALLHGDMNGRPVSDTLWMASVFLSAVAVQYSPLVDH
jgi:hypothetical protein